jgi:hypothetical protein
VVGRGEEAYTSHLAEEIEPAVAEASCVLGVEHVDNRLEVFEPPDDVPALQGGVTQRG